MKSLYDKTHRMTEAALALDASTHERLSAIFAEFAAKGFSPREIAHVMHEAVSDLERETVLTS